MSEKEIGFGVKLDNEDWIRYRKGWRCEALRIPGAKIIGVYDENIGELPRGDWERAEGEEIILWKGLSNSTPDSLLVRFRLTEGLSTKKNEKLHSRDRCDGHCFSRHYHLPVSSNR